MICVLGDLIYADYQSDKREHTFKKCSFPSLFFVGTRGIGRWTRSRRSILRSQHFSSPSSVIRYKHNKNTRTIPSISALNTVTLQNLMGNASLCIDVLPDRIDGIIANLAFVERLILEGEGGSVVIILTL